MTKRVILIVLLVFSLFVAFLFLVDPPVGEQINRDPHTYLKTNRFVSSERKDLQQSGIFHSDFLPETIVNETNVKYLFWYCCSFLGNPSYAITLSVPFPDRESYLAEYKRLTQLQDFSVLKENDTTVIECNVFPAVLDLLDPPMLGGCVYPMEYAIADEKTLTITYTEFQILEGQKRCEEIESQVQFLYNIHHSIR